MFFKILSESSMDMSVLHMNHLENERKKYELRGRKQYISKLSFPVVFFICHENRSCSFGAAHIISLMSLFL